MHFLFALLYLFIIIVSTFCLTGGIWLGDWIGIVMGGGALTGTLYASRVFRYL